MQRLVFESAWDKTIAPADRENIIKLFNETKDNNEEGIILHSIRQAQNHRSDLLAIVLIHNFSDEILSFHKMDVTYTEQERELAKGQFSFPNLHLEPRTSMPWTFIFPKSALLDTPSFENGRLIINKISG